MPASDVTRSIAAFIATADFSSLPRPVIDKAKWLILDSIANQFAGACSAPARHVVQWVRALEGKPEATLVGHHLKAPAALAAFANGTMAHAVEMDDAHRDALVKAGSVIVPATLAACEKASESGRKAIAGLVTGYEVMIRLGLAVNPGHRRRNFHSTGSLGSFGAAAAAANIIGLDTEQTSSALGIAGTQAAGLAAFLDDPGSMSKGFNAGKGAMNGLMAAELAANGFVGPRRILEGDEGFALAVSDEVRFDQMTAGLGAEWRILEVGFKPHAACRYAHGPIDAAHEVLSRCAAAVDDIRSVTIRASVLAHRQSGNNAPTTLAGAQGSTPFSVALSLVCGKPYLQLADFQNAWRDNNHPVHKFVRSVQMEPDERRFGYMTRACEIEIVRNDGATFLAQSTLPKGEPENPLTENELREKYFSLVVPVAGSRMAEEVYQRVYNLDTADSMEAIIRRLADGDLDTFADAS